MKDVRKISRDKDFFEQMKQIMGEKSWCFIDEKVVEHIKNDVGCHTIDNLHKRIDFLLGRKDISIEYDSYEIWHRVRWVKVQKAYVCVCKDPEEVIFITME